MNHIPKGNLVLLVRYHCLYHTRIPDTCYIVYMMQAWYDKSMIAVMFDAPTMGVYPSTRCCNAVVLTRVCIRADEGDGLGSIDDCFVAARRLQHCTGAPVPRSEVFSRKYRRYLVHSQYFGFMYCGCLLYTSDAADE